MIDAFKLWCWRKLMRVPWTARRSNWWILKEINPEYSLEGLMLKLDAPVFWPPDMKNWLIGKDSDAEKDWRQEEQGKTEDEMVKWHHRLNRDEFEQALGVGDGQGGLACCSLQGRKESDTTEWLNSNQSHKPFQGAREQTRVVETRALEANPIKAPRQGFECCADLWLLRKF